MYTSILNLLSDIGVLSACVKIGTLDAEGFDIIMFILFFKRNFHQKSYSIEGFILV